MTDIEGVCFACGQRMYLHPAQSVFCPTCWSSFHHLQDRFLVCWWTCLTHSLDRRYLAPLINAGLDLIDRKGKGAHMALVAPPRTLHAQAAATVRNKGATRVISGEDSWLLSNVFQSSNNPLSQDSYATADGIPIRHPVPPVRTVPRRSATDSETDRRA